MNRKISGSIAVKKTAAGLRQKTFWSKRNWWRTRATPLIDAASPVRRPAGSAPGRRPRGSARRTSRPGSPTPRSARPVGQLAQDRRPDRSRVSETSPRRRSGRAARTPSGRSRRATPCRQPEADLGARLAVAAEVLGRARRDDPPGRDDRDAVGEHLRLVHVVGGEEDRLAELAQAGDHLPGLAARRGVEAGGRLVEEEQLGVADQRQRHVEAALLAARERRGPGVRLLGEADQARSSRRRRAGRA